MTNGPWLALDIGSRRIGVALARADVRIPQPLTTIEQSDEAITAICRLVQENDVQQLVVGLPRGMNGQETEQTKSTESFGKKLETAVSVPIAWQDEALTSQKAEAELAARKKPFAKGDVDALAATYILEDYLNEHVRGSYV